MTPSWTKQDVLLFEECASGPGLPYDGSPLCEQTDLDYDNDVDQADFGLFSDAS